MVLLNVKLTDVSTKGLPQMDPAVYDALEAVKVELVPPKDDKAGVIRVTFRDANAEDGDERSIRKGFSLSERALVFLKRWLLACGKPDLANAEELDTEDFIGLCAKAVVKSESVVDKDTGEMRTYSQIDRFIISDEFKED